MPPGRKPLAPETKREHRRLSSAVYEASNVDKRREAAKLRMRRRRETIANSDYHTKRKYRARAAEHSERYRDRKLEEERVERNSTSIVKRRERKLEADKLRALTRRHRRRDLVKDSSSRTRRRKWRPPPNKCQ
ncbi:hypothetical protein K438DRAFT_1998701 [Mycena galopus ATCC 62051]|nr:hypothetical protein K438DRAFT_1998701 [Mycena galopus ATCC 62051]